MPTEEQINSALSLDDLSKLISNCDRCPLGKLKTKDVPGVGDPNSSVLFIGEAPGKQEDMEGEPFVGAAGKFLNEMLDGIGWNRGDIYIANVLKHRPPENRDPLPAEIEACWPFLRKQIEIIRPKLIVFLGRHAMNRFFPTLKISEVHGKAFRKEWNGSPQTFLALYHPAAALYNGGMRATLIEDFAKIPKIVEKIELQKAQNKKQEKLF
jgi:uracil-DNA glycosylase